MWRLSSRRAKPQILASCMVNVALQQNQNANAIKCSIQSNLLSDDTRTQQNLAEPLPCGTSLLTRCIANVVI